MTKLIITCRFHSAHFLPDHPKCGQMHGHSYKVEVEYHGPIGITDGMIRDFSLLRHEIDQVLARYDHKTINDSLSQPTAENLALAILTELKARFDADGPVKGGYKRVRIWETDDYSAEVEVTG